MSRKSLNWTELQILAAAAKENPAKMPLGPSKNGVRGAQFVPKMKAAILHAIESTEIAVPVHSYRRARCFSGGISRLLEVGLAN